MSTLDLLKRDLRTVRTLAYQLLDTAEADADEMKALLCLTHDNRQVRDNPVRVDEYFFFAEAYEWGDDREFHGEIDLLEWVVPIKGYDTFVAFSRVNVGRPDTVAKLEQILPKLPPALFRKQVEKAMNVFRLNPLSITGNDFFSSSHPHPADQGTYDNIVAVSWTDPANPTDAEMVDMLDEVVQRFIDNFSIQSQVVDAKKFQSNLTVMAHRGSTHRRFWHLLRADKLTGDKINPYRDGFRLRQDMHPTAGQENWLEVIQSEPNGPRPAILVLDQDPVLQAYDENKVRNGFFGVGYDSMFGVKPGEPLTTIQVRPT